MEQNSLIFIYDSGTIVVFIFFIISHLLSQIYLLFGKSFDVTYGNVSVRTFSSNVVNKKMRKGTLTNQNSGSIADSPLEMNMYEKSPYRNSSVLEKNGHTGSSSDIYSHNRFIRTNTKTPGNGPKMAWTQTRTNSY